MHVGIDPSASKTAIVLLTDKTYFYSDFEASLPEDASFHDRVRRLLSIRNWVCDLLSGGSAAWIERGTSKRLATRLQVSVDTPIGIESAAYSRGLSSSAQLLAEIRSHIACGLWERGYTGIEEVGVTKSRAQVLGKGWGRASKPEIARELVFRGHQFKNRDVMDAWVVASALKGVHVPEPPNADPRRRYQ
jgi:hypothetical protein